jgi:hypothetical protein
MFEKLFDELLAVLKDNISGYLRRYIPAEGKLTLTR